MMAMMNARRAVAIIAFAVTSHTTLWAEAFTASRRLSRRAFTTSTPRWSHHALPPHNDRRGDRPLRAGARISISDAFDGGNIEFVETTKVNDWTTTVVLRIKPDPYTELENVEHMQHFYFRSTVSDLPSSTHKVRYEIENAFEASYPDAWRESTVFFSERHSDPTSWLRKLDTTYQDGRLTWTHQHAAGEAVFFAYFPPFSYERHMKLIAKCAASEHGKVESLGQTLDGCEMELITVGTGSRACWVIHRQHPGESMAEYYAEGLLNRLLGLNTAGSIDGMACRALDLYTFYIVPNMNPDGAIRGHLRTNAGGSNLNREWASTRDRNYDYDAPTLERSPEVYHVLKKMDETGVDVFLDVHGDEELPVAFIAGAEGCPNWGPRLYHLQGAFVAAYSRANSDMQQEIGYDPEPPGQAKMNAASNQIATRFDCLSVTLEMPFKDSIWNPDPERGWNPARASMLGASLLDALDYVRPYLRDDTPEFWEIFPEEDAYVEPSNLF